MERRTFDFDQFVRIGRFALDIREGRVIVPSSEPLPTPLKLKFFEKILNGHPLREFFVWGIFQTKPEDILIPQPLGSHARISLKAYGIDPPTENAKAVLIDGKKRIMAYMEAFFSDTESFYLDLDVLKVPGAQRFYAGKAHGPHHVPTNILLNGDKVFDFTLPLRREGKRDLARLVENAANLIRDIPIITSLVLAKDVQEALRIVEDL